MKRPGPPIFCLSPLLAAAAVAVAAQADSAQAAEVVARVGPSEVTAGEVRAWLDTLGPQQRAALAKDPALLAKTLRGYLAQKAVLQAAMAKKLDQDPAVRAQLERARENALAELYLQSVSQPPPGYPTLAEVKATWEAEANRAAFELPRESHLAQIFVAAPRGEVAEGPESRLKLEAIEKSLAAPGADFAAIARALSDEPGAAERSGEIGWLTETQLVPGIRPAVATLSPGLTSPPLRLEDGWHIVKLLEIRPARKKPLAEVKEAIVARLREERALANRKAYLDRLLEQDPPAINELALSKVLDPAR